MTAEPARDQIPEWDVQANTLERFEEDVLIFTHAVPKDRKVTLGPKLLQQFPKGSPQREIGWETSEVRCVTTGGRCHSAIETHSAASRKRLATRCFRTLQTFPTSFRTSVSTINATLYCRRIKLARASATGGQVRDHFEQDRD